LKLGRKSDVPATLESQDLSLETFCCVVRRGHPARSRPSLQEYAALDHLLIAPTPSVGVEPIGVVDALLAKQELRRRIVMSVPHFLVAPFVVASSDLALTAPARLLVPFVKPLGLRRLELPVKIPSYKLSQIWAERTRDDDGHKWLRSVVAGTLRSEAP
jgi:DNA-binding transcriptional LysR family regulator